MRRPYLTPYKLNDNQESQPTKKVLDYEQVNLGTCATVFFFCSTTPGNSSSLVEQSQTSQQQDMQCAQSSSAVTNVDLHGK